MVKNLPLLFFILIIGVSSSTVSMNGHLPFIVEYAFMIMSFILNVTAVIGLSLHVFVYKPMKKAEENL
ncbi:hypothetical protein [Priestia endophytica]|uniref:hypothetical protein n=1 Tax=Priestia endophytica TaxID=135735 RepID=UPI00227E75B8|nr:hypothetical protein [Priestia endophytica]MCY8235058.1 hypothetical protein [Priestia endophytica]